MVTGHIDTFETAAREANAAVTRTTADGFPAALAAAVEEPAVGTELPHEGISLSGTAVTVGPTTDKLAAARTGVTPAGFGIAEYGSVVVESTAAGEEPASLFPERHVAVLAAGDLVADLPAAVEQLAALAGDGRDAVVATGPSATADMGELVYGAHGPREVHVLLLEDR